MLTRTGRARGLVYPLRPLPGNQRFQCTVGDRDTRGPEVTFTVSTDRPRPVPAWADPTPSVRSVRRTGPLVRVLLQVLLAVGRLTVLFRGGRVGTDPVEQGRKVSGLRVSTLGRLFLYGGPSSSGLSGPLRLSH